MVRGRHGLRLRQQHIPFLFAIAESHIAKQACEWLWPKVYHLRQLLQLRPSDRVLPDSLQGKAQEPMPELVPGRPMIWVREAQEGRYLFASPDFLVRLESFQLGPRHEAQIIEPVERSQAADSKMVGEVNHIVQLNV